MVVVTELPPPLPLPLVMVLVLVLATKETADLR